MCCFLVCISKRERKIQIGLFLMWAAAYPVHEGNQKIKMFKNVTFKHENLQSNVGLNRTSVVGFSWLRVLSSLKSFLLKSVKDWECLQAQLVVYFKSWYKTKKVVDHTYPFMSLFFDNSNIHVNLKENNKQKLSLTEDESVVLCRLLVSLAC